MVPALARGSSVPASVMGPTAASVPLHTHGPNSVVLEASREKKASACVTTKMAETVLIPTVPDLRGLGGGPASPASPELDEPGPEVQPAFPNSAEARHRAARPRSETGCFITGARIIVQHRIERS